jgi:uncharacterized protein (DUF697 family)
MPNETKIHAIIHTAAAAAAVVGAELAQLPCADSVALRGIQATMIGAIAREHGADYGDAASMELLVNFTAANVGRKVAQVAVGWLPGWGNLINATTAASLTEAIGWAAHRYFAAGNR